MIGYIVDIEFVWGFQARIAGLTKTSPSFYYPPPTTFLGALAEVIAKENNIGENEGKRIIPKLGNNLLAIGWKPLNCIPIKYADINKIIAIKETSGILYPHPKDLVKSFDSPARGRTILSTLDNNAPKIRWFIVFRKNKFIFNGDEMEVNADSFWKMHRISSKESRISVTDVKRVTPVIIKNKSVTNYSIPVKEGMNLIRGRGEWRFEYYVDPFEMKTYDNQENPLINYLTKKKIILFGSPILISILSTPEYIVEFNNKFAAYKYEKEVVIGRWSK